MVFAVVTGMRVERKRTITPLMVGHSLNRQLPFGRTTERFFVEGEQHEANQWEDTILPLDDEPEPKRRRGSIDKVPRQRGALFALAVFAICLVLGVAAAVSALLRAGNRVSDSVTAFKASPVPANQQEPPKAAPIPSETPKAIPPAPGPVPVPAIVPPAQPPATRPAPVPQPAQDESAREALRKAGLAEQPSVEEPKPVQATADKTPQAKGAETQAKSIEAEAGEETSADDSRATQAHHKNRHDSNSTVTTHGKKRHHRHPRENYVWSPEANALVPESSVAATPESPFESAPSANRLPNPFSSSHDDLSPPPLRHSSAIAPATTGAPPRERAAPNADDSDPFQR